MKTRWIAASLTLLAMTMLCPPAFAEPKKDEKPAAEETSKDEDSDDKKETEEVAKEDDKSFRFAPDFCDFEITLPEEPSIAQKCVPGGECYDLNSYVMVYDLQTTVDVSVTCNPSTPSAYDKYTEGVMKAALAGMVENRNLTSHEVRFQDLKEEGVKSAALSGGGLTGRQEKIYTAQLWIGPNSVFTIQAELIGAAHETADKSFGDILSSIKSKKGKQVPRPKKAAIPKLGNQ